MLMHQWGYRKPVLKFLGSKERVNLAKDIFLVHLAYGTLFFFFSHFLIFTLIFQLYTKFVETLQSCIWTHTAFVSKSWLDEQPIINLNNWRFFLFTGTEICSTGHWVGAHHITEFAPRVEQEYSTILVITNDLSLANFFVFKLINLQLLS